MGGSDAGSKVVAALVRRGDRLVLVQQQAPHDPEPTWALPAGRVEAGEDLRAALERELQEETGLAVQGEPRLVFSVEVRDAGVTAHTFECEVAGTILPNDPDGFVQAVEWIEINGALARLHALDWYDADPLRAWLSKF